ncbi:MAG: PH domain-containing protein [Thermoplasmata archaeon]
MAAPSSHAPGPHPKLLRATYLAGGEALLKETRATAIFYLPGPIVALLLLAVLDVASASARYGGSGLPWLTPMILQLPTIAGYAPGTYVFLASLALTFLALLWLLVRYLRWISTVYAVTTHRVILQKGIIGRDFEEIPIPQVRGVDVRQTILQRMLRYGTVQVSSEGGSPRIGNEEWKGIPRPFEFQRLVEAANQGLARGALPPMGWNPPDGPR